ncbi:hypothetical protein X805_29440 [Sphaerotilus natans subsp. natans DSM 6575]|jgi:ABC-type branched-subunit amino acid transport system substrate-binding protein|uniref:Leucine-binding protein domain-containing protein n=1 Tax=Sphaerotilus natans subsp. natans DSM 6575 TaxID=1286631 RepID=A0A059KJ50_9BURK|nr:ABC transporter substrate-binding protein [Sphaerotilus natans]KDB51482.1 hypothetical protein X805_29440 [Sphaerotilus natans subsp. natans DSM 6575]SIQ05269.1 amino acid/amide ABC transporter substrate-binding protein, HAAT family [Sphaerotilus natans]
MHRRSLVLAGAAAPLGLLPPRARAAATPILIGRTAPQQGPTAAMARAHATGANLAFEASNAAGGISGRPIRWADLDDGGDPARALALARALIVEQQALALFGCAGSPSLAALEPLLREHGVPAVGAVAVADSVRSLCRGVGFFPRASHAQEAEVLARHLATVGLQRVAIAHTATPFGQEGLKLIGDALAAQRLQVVGSAALTAEDATAQEASRKLMALSPQAVVLFVPGSQAAAMMATATGLKRHPAFFGLSIVGDDEAMRRIGPQARGLALTQVTPNPWRETDRQMELYRQQARAAGVEIGYASLAGWIDAQVLIEALRRCGGQLQRPRLTATLRVMQLFVAGMAIDFSRQDLGGSRFVDLVQRSESGRYLG